MTGEVIDLGLCDYGFAHEMQLDSVRGLLNGSGPERIILCEHNNIFTVGRRGTRKNILVSDGCLQEKGIGLKYVERGGDVTYHGPGQLVIYPILDLKRRKKDILLFLEQLEGIAAGLLMQYGLEAQGVSGLRGIWVGGKKVASIGVSFRNWVSFHGMSINLNCDTEFFRLINPCGMTDKSCTSVYELTGKSVDISQAKDIIIKLSDFIFDTKWIKNENFSRVA